MVLLRTLVRHAAVFLEAFVDAWKWSGIATLVYIAGINAVPRELLEN